jgi:alanyl-tRNA synthetase
VQVETGELGALAEDVASQLPSGVIVLAIKMADRCQVVLKLTPDLVKKGWNAANILKESAPIIGGSGGGRPEMAQAGGKSPENLDKFFAAIERGIK